MLDTSVLLNRLRVERLDLLIDLPGHEFLVTDHVRGEVTDDGSSRILTAALTDKRLREARVDAPEEVLAFGQLAAVRTLGEGECAALAVAVCRRLPIAIDDKAARKKARAVFGFDQFAGTADLVVAAIRGGLVDVDVADQMKRRWEIELRFRRPFRSFGDIRLSR